MEKYGQNSLNLSKPFLETTDLKKEKKKERKK